MAEASSTALPGELGAAFEPLRVLGKGAFATVLAARDRALDRPVALKLLHRKDKESRRRFLREAEVMAELSSPFVVRVFDSGEAEGTPYLVMELVEGATLGQGPAPAAPWAVLADVAEGLAQIHAAGLVHRDVKPQNIMVTRAGRAVLLDLGLVRGRTDRTRLTRDGMLVGSLRYLCPEGMRGARATPAADWYALGTVAFELLEGRAPYRDEEVLARLEGEEHTPVEFRRLAPESPDARVIRALLESVPERRRVPADLYRQVLGREVPATLRGATEPRPAPPAPQRGRAPAWAGLLVLGLLGAAGASWLRGRAASPPVRPASPPDGEVRPGDPELAAVRDAVARLTRGHQDDAGQLQLSLRGHGYEDHQLEVAQEYVDPRLPVRWRRLGEHLGVLERVLGVTPEGRAKLERVFLEEVYPALQHLLADKGMLVVVRMGSAMPGAVLPENLRHLTAEETASLRARLDEVSAQAAGLASSLEMLRVPRSPALVAARADLLATDEEAPREQILEDLLTRAGDPRGTEAERALLWRAALGALPSGFRMTTAPCPLRLRVLGDATAWLEGATGIPDAARAMVAGAGIQAWFGTMGDCARATPEVMLPTLERLLVVVEDTWRAAPAETVQLLRWSLLLESGLLLYGYSSTATDPATARIWDVLLAAAEADDPGWVQQHRRRRSR